MNRYGKKDSCKKKSQFDRIQTHKNLKGTLIWYDSIKNVRIFEASPLFQATLQQLNNT